MANKKTDLTALINQVKKTNVETPVQKVVPVQKPSTPEKGLYVKVPSEMITFLKNKASLIEGMTLKELINNALEQFYEDDYKEFLKRYHGKIK